MNRQRPDQNNPANPLLKVAALTLGAVDLETLTHGKRRSRVRRIQAVASLNFKKSDDLRGNAKSVDGHDITVCFSMSLKRASFQLSATFEGHKKTLPRITNVAFLSPFVVEYKVNDETIVRHGFGKGYEFSGAGAMQLSDLTPGATARGGAAGNVKSGTEVRNVRKSKRAFKETNVSVTHGGNQIHWELTPALRDPESDVQCLEGEVFQSHNTAQPIPACVLSWSADDQKGQLLIVGSVYTLMSDMMVKNIVFVDELGKKVEWKDIDRGPREKTYWSISLNSSGQEKERLLKQIIRKHLLSQGMAQDGARVEICRAYL